MFNQFEAQWGVLAIIPVREGVIEPTPGAKGTAP